ncbi:hypothetical protein ACIGHN_23870 [Acidovorax sp. NPDC077693]|uniref:hypothetical protein n=1 Tax=unclassified Acidovorax TaxID=2684926 RepID=UPI0037CC4129
MWPFDEIARAARTVVEKAKEVVTAVVETAVDAAAAAGDAIAGAAGVVGGAIRTVAGVVGGFLRGRLGLIRRWVVNNWGDTWYGHAAQGLIDLVRIGVGAVELGVKVLGAVIVLGGQVIGDVLKGDWSEIPGRFDEFNETVRSDWEEMNLALGEWVIDESVIGRKVTGAPRTRAVAWSVAAGLEINEFGTRDPRTYRDTGIRYEFELRDGEVFFRACTMTDSDPAWQKLVFQPNDSQGSMIGFDHRRMGDLTVEVGSNPPNVQGPVMPAPRFESISANADRVFAKEEGKDNFYFLLMDELFWGPTTLSGADPYDSPMLEMPSNYFKIDPEQNKPSADLEDIEAPLLGPLPKIPQSERHGLFREVLKQGALGMVVKVKPRLWYRIDCRPPLDSGEPPEILPMSAGVNGISVPTYGHVTRRSITKFIGGAQSPQIEQSIDFQQVLDIGVGNTHYHEPWTNIYGGELRNTRLEYFQRLALGELTYSFLNGPLTDGDHFADGTCNFYVLVRLYDSDNYVVLYCDEQTFFTQRWRLANPADGAPVEMTSMNFSIAGALDGTRDRGMYAFEPGQFWSPFGSRYLNQNSRMAVSRTVVMLSGADPHSGHAELYSANVGYGVFDRTWRFRDLNAAGFHIAPAFTSSDECRMADASLPVESLASRTAKDGRVEGIAPKTVWPQTVRLREDMQIVLVGTGAGVVPGEVFAGVWTQSLLPADCEVHPSKEIHAQGPIAGAGQLPPKPRRGFSHPWNFWSESVFVLADRFSHLGVYAPVNARTQFYVLDVLDGSDVEELPGTWTFIDDPLSTGPQPGQLYIKALKLHWGVAARHAKTLMQDFYSQVWGLVLPITRLIASVLSAVEPVLRDGLLRWEVPPRDAVQAEEQLRASRRSMYLRDGVFDLAWRGPLGLIATWHDKRDDDLMPLSDLPMETTLVTAGAGGRRLRVRFRQHYRATQPPVVQWARVVLLEGRHGPAVEVRYRSNRTPHDLQLQLHSLHLAALDSRREAGGFVVDLLSGLQHQSMSAVAGRDGEWVGQFPVTTAWVADHARYLGPQGRLAYGTSLWFMGPTGLVAIPEATEFD